VFNSEDGVDMMINYFNGENIYKPFGEGQDDDFIVIKNRIKDQMKTMPLTLKTTSNHNYPASDLILEKKQELLIKYAPTKV
jgi:hypothetical protein